MNVRTEASFEAIAGPNEMRARARREASPDGQTRVAAPALVTTGRRQAHGSGLLSPAPPRPSPSQVARDRRRAPGRGRCRARDPARSARSTRSSTWCSPTATATTRRSPPTAGSRSGGPATATLRASSRPRAATRSPTSRPTSSRRSPTSGPTRTRTGRDNAYPHAYDQIAQLFDSPPRPTSACSTRPRTTGRTRAATSASTARSASCRPARRSCSRARACATLGVDPRRGPPRRRRADGRRAPRLRAARRRPRTSRSRTATPATDVLDAERTPAPRRRLPLRRHQRERALRHGRARRGAERRAAHRDGRRVRARRDGVAADRHAREPHVDHHRRAPRSPRHPATTRGTTARRGEQIITNSSATWPTAMQHLTPGVESIHDAVHRTWPDAFTASVNEPCDTGADYSTFDFFRRGEVPPIPKRPDGPAAHHRAVRAAVEGLLVVVGRRPHGHRPGRSASSAVTTATSTTRCPASCGATSRSPTPRCTKAARTPRWRPRRCATATRRLGEVLAARRAARASFDDTAFVLVADHGMEENDPACTGDWDVALRAGRPRRSATRPTASSTSASDARPSMRRDRGRASSSR